MKKFYKNYEGIQILNKFSSKKFLKTVSKVLCISLGIIVCFFAFAPMFNLTLFKQKQTEFCTSYYIIYTTPEEKGQDAITKSSQNLKMRGAAGNIETINGNGCIILTLCKTDEDAQQVILNLEKQNIKCEDLELKIKLTTKNCTELQEKIFKNLYKSNIEIIEKIILFIDALEKNESSQTDISIELFGLYSNLNAITFNTENTVDEKTKKYYQQTIQIQSLLYLLSLNEHLENNVPYASFLRFYLYKILKLATT